MILKNFKKTLDNSPEYGYGVPMNIYPCCDHCSPEPGSMEHEHTDPCFYGCDGPVGDVDFAEDPYGDDVAADAAVLAGAGWGTDEDYGYAGDFYDY